MDGDTLIPITLFIGIFSTPIAICFFYLKFRSKKLEIIEKMLDSNREISAEMLAILNPSSTNTAANDVRLAVFYLAIGFAIFLMLVFQVFANPARLSLLSLLPLSIGISYLVASRMKES